MKKMKWYCVLWCAGLLLPPGLTAKNNARAVRPPIPVAYIYGYNAAMVVAQVTNAGRDQVAYSSFESADQGYWTYAGTPAGSATDGGRTGQKYYLLSGGNIQRTGLLKGRYILSYWGNGSATLTGVNFTLAGQTAVGTYNGWTLYEATVDLSLDNSSITVSGTAKIDELRLHPADAQMVTYTYDPLVGKTSETDANNATLYYEYDEFNRLKCVKDQAGNVRTGYQYRYKNQ
jgi:YD repeat-containing protein